MKKSLMLELDEMGLGREMQLAPQLIKCLAQEDREVTFLQGPQGRIAWIKALL